MHGQLSLAFKLAADAVELPVEHHGIAGAPRRVLLEQVADNLVHIMGKLGNQLDRPVKLGISMLVEQLGRLVSLERSSAGEKRVEHYPQGV